MSSSQASPDQIKQSTNHAFYAYGTYRIFERRALSLRSKRNAITFLGIIVPLSVGSLILSFGAMPKLLPYVVALAGIAGTLQLVLSAWSIVARWDEQYSYATTAMLANTRLFNSWERLIKNPPGDFQQAFSELEAENGRQEQSDLAAHITQKEKQFAMRAALLHMGLPCATCKVRPISLKPSGCDTCGNF